MVNNSYLTKNVFGIFLWDSTSMRFYKIIVHSIVEKVTMIALFYGNNHCATRTAKLFDQYTNKHVKQK